MTRPTAIYLRVSSVGQADDDKFGLDVQAQAVRQYAERLGLTLTDTYTDTISGTRHRRDDLDRLLDRAPAYEAVIISSVDRLGRRNRINYAVLDELLDTGLEVHSADMGVIDPEDEGSMLNFGVRSLFSELDHRRLVQKLYRAKVAKVAGNPLSGKAGKPANPLSCYGWRRDEIVPHEQQWVIYMYQRLQVVGTQVLARELDERGVRTRRGGLWTAAKLRLLVQNPVYKGVYEFGRRGGRGQVVARCEVTPFVSTELWDSVNRRMRERHASTQARQSARLLLFPLTGHIRCGECRRAMNGLQTGRRQYGYYQCSSSHQGKYNASGRDCTHKKLYRAEQVHEVVAEALQRLTVAPGDLAGLVRVPAVSPPDHTAALADLNRREGRLEAAYMAGAYTPEEYAERRSELRRQRQSIESAPVPFEAPAADVAGLQERLAAALAEPLPVLADRMGLRVVIAPGGEIALELDPPVVT